MSSIFPDKEKFFEILHKHNCYIPISQKESKGKVVQNVCAKFNMNYVVFDDRTCLISAASKEWYEDEPWAIFVDPNIIHNDYDEKYFSDWEEFGGAQEEWNHYRESKKEEDLLERERILYERLKLKFESK